MDDIWFYVYATPDYRDPQQRRGLVFRLVPGYIWVNQQGRRFHNESLTGGASASPALLGAEPAPRLGDPRHADDGEDGSRRSLLSRRRQVIERAKVEELLDNSPYIKKADTLDELAQADAASKRRHFLAEVERYNKASTRGSRRSRSSASRSRRRRNSTRRPTTRSRSFPWRARTSAASRPTCAAAC